MCQWIYLIKKNPTVLENIFFDGDALTEERARNIQINFKDGYNTYDRLEGLDPVHTDWHAKVKLYEVENNLFFKRESAAELGTTCASMNRTGKTNAKKGPHVDYNAFKDFNDREVEAHIIASFMTFLGIDSLDGKPTNVQLPNISTTKPEQRSWLYQILLQYLDRFVFDESNFTEFTHRVSQLDENSKTKYPCRAPGCPKLYCFNSGRVRHEIAAHPGLSVPGTPASDERDAEGYYKCRCGSVFMSKATRK
ncbi:hypothetical protein QZH41_016825 [Actinostola sp. cb2023]|nr:hypothetical protein QZH41_016825 [Actinostola sp. cb2023]